MDVHHLMVITRGLLRTPFSQGAINFDLICHLATFVTGRCPIAQTQNGLLVIHAWRTPYILSLVGENHTIDHSTKPRGTFEGNWVTPSGCACMPAKPYPLVAFQPLLYVNPYRGSRPSETLVMVVVGLLR